MVDSKFQETYCQALLQRSFCHYALMNCEYTDICRSRRRCSSWLFVLKGGKALGSNRGHRLIWPKRAVAPDGFTCDSSVFDWMVCSRKFSFLNPSSEKQYFTSLSDISARVRRLNPDTRHWDSKSIIFKGSVQVLEHPQISVTILSQLKFWRNVGSALLKQ